MIAQAVLYMVTASVVTFLTFYRVLTTERIYAVLVGREGARTTTAHA